MLLTEAREHGLEIRAMLAQSRKRDVLPGMMEAIRILAQIADDVLHQLIVKCFAAIEEVNLSLQQGKQAVEILVLGVPHSDRIRHAQSPMYCGLFARSRDRRSVVHLDEDQMRPSGTGVRCLYSFCLSLNV